MLDNWELRSVRTDAARPPDPWKLDHLKGAMHSSCRKVYWRTVNTGFQGIQNCSKQCLDVELGRFVAGRYAATGWCKTHKAPTNRQNKRAQETALAKFGTCLIITLHIETYIYIYIYVHMHMYIYCDACKLFQKPIPGLGNNRLLAHPRQAATKLLAAIRLWVFNCFWIQC